MIEQDEFENYEPPTNNKAFLIVLILLFAVISGILWALAQALDV